MVLGKAILQLEFPFRNIPLPAHVVPEISEQFDILIGDDWMAAQQIQLDWNSGHIKFPNQPPKSAISFALESLTPSKSVILNPDVMVLSPEHTQFDSPTKYDQPLSEDIRLLPQYITFAEQQLHFKKSDYKEAFNEGADCTKQDWAAGSALWVNPPWRLLQAATEKLLRK